MKEIEVEMARTQKNKARASAARSAVTSAARGLGVCEAR